MEADEHPPKVLHTGFRPACRVIPEGDVPGPFTPLFRKFAVLAALHNYQSGSPLRVTSNQNIGIFSGTIRANIVGGQSLKNPAYTGDPNVERYINTAAFSRPANFTFGNSGAMLGGLRSPRLISEDVTLGKEFPLFSEARHVEFKASAFNIGNRVQFGGINNSVDSPAFGRITSQTNKAREIQLSLRLVFQWHAIAVYSCLN